MLFVIALLGLLAQENLKVSLLPESALMSELERFPLKNAERQERVRELFAQAHCPQIESIPLGKKEVPANVACIWPGTTERTILVGAHFDKVQPGEGKLDNGSGSVLLSALAQALANKPRRHTFVFVGFAEEEVGLVGSAALVKKGLGGKTGKEFLAGISAVVNMDSVGAGPTAVALSHSDERLATVLLRLGEKLQLPVKLVNVDRVGRSDGASFKEKKIKVLEVHSLDQDTYRYLHTPFDTMKAMKAKEYKDTYALMAFYLAFLDATLDASPDAN